MIDLDHMEAQLVRATTGVAPPRRVPLRPGPVPAPRRAARDHRPPPPAVEADPRPARSRRRAAAPQPEPAPEPEPAPRAHGRAHRPEPVATVAGLLEAGRLVEVDDRIAGTTDERDRLTWTTMRALLAGRRDEAGAGVHRLAELGRTTDDA